VDTAEVVVDTARVAVAVDVADTAAVAVEDLVATETMVATKKVDGTNFVEAFTEFNTHQTILLLMKSLAASSVDVF